MHEVGRPARPARNGGRHEIRVWLYLFLILLDSLAVLLAFSAGTFVRFGDLGDRSAFDIAVVTLPIFIGIAVNSRAYTIEVLRSGRVGISRAAGALAFAFASFLFISYYFRLLQDVSRLAIIVGMAASFVGVAAFRFLFDRTIQRLYDGHVTYEILIRDGVPFFAPPRFVAVDAPAIGLRPDTRDPMMLDRLAGVLRGADRAVIACRPDGQRAWAMLLKGANIQGEIVATEFDEVGALGVGEVAGRSTLVVAVGPLSIRNRVIKRTFDLCIAVPLLIVLAPVLMIAAVAIKLDSRGPVFFKQRRVGRGNALFEVYKFRSMRVEASDADGRQSASRDDDRITRVGALMRASSVDELPQLLNVLFGSMSIVGPRPHALGSLAGQQLFWEVDERYWHRHSLKPGITGLAQVRGFRGATHERDDLTRRLQADLEYIAGWSVLRDVGILFRTLLVVVHKNAF